jgi:hypothetical protein
VPPAIHFPAERVTRGSWPVKKGRHRRFEEARALKRTAIFDPADDEPCPECGAEAGDEHASWCMFDADAEDDG